VTSILIVEDDPHFRNALHRELEGHSFAVRAAAGVDEALVMLCESPADIVLTDLRLVGKDGIDLLKRLPVVASRARAILMSAFATARDHQIATELGAVTVLVKPFTASVLLRTIQKAIDCETGFQGSVHGLSLIDMAQMFHLAQRSVTILIHRRGAAPSKIHFVKGQIVHAEHRGLLGTKALQALLATPSGTLSTAALTAGTPQTIDTPFAQLLISCLNHLDEEAHAAHRRERAARPRVDLDELDDIGEHVGMRPVPRPALAAPPPLADDESPPEPADDSDTQDSIYAASQSMVQMPVASVEPAPPLASVEPSSPPPPQPALSQACKDLLLSIDAAVVSVIVSLASGHVLGVYQLGELDAQAGAAVAAATREVFCGPALVRLNELEADTKGDLSRQEAQLTTPQYYFFAKLLPDQRNAIGLLTRKTINIGMGWALLRASLTKVQPLLQ
jgi:CheY-like chemotaxis protein